MTESELKSNVPTEDNGESNLKQVEAQLRRMTKVFMDGADPIVIRDLNGNVLDINRETERVFGWSREEVLGARTRHLLSPEFRELADDTLRRVQRGETIRNVEAAVRTKSGEVVPVLATVFPLTDENDKSVAYAEIVKDISELKQATEELRQRNRELKQFANVLAHDLSAPLRTVRSFADLLQAHCGNELNEKGREDLRYIVEGVQRMDRLVADLLDFTQVGRQSAAYTSVDCEQLFKQVLSNLHAAINETGAEVTRESMPTIHANATQMVQLFQNLIGNAIKFHGSEPPKVHISAEPREGVWEFCVCDNGIGIETESQDKIFDVFGRLHNDDEFPGTGIGLAICKAIIEQHGGRIWVESEKGSGSVFRFTVP